jgi:hypothetical protein
MQNSVFERRQSLGMEETVCDVLPVDGAGFDHDWGVANGRDFSYAGEDSSVA